MTSSRHVTGRRARLALESLPPGWRIADPEGAGALIAGMVEGATVRILVEVGEAEWLAGIAPAASEPASLTVRVTDRAVAGMSTEIVLHPPVLALGLGCRRGVSEDDLVGLALDCLGNAALSPASVACVASLDSRSAEPAIHALAARLAVPARFFSVGELAAERDRLLRPSAAVERAVGVAGVAEGAALAAAGPAASLVAPKRVGVRATCAIARCLHPIDPSRFGAPG
jgi:cobalt-precorrin 5A hydrolase / precorrin-3B C17-methyltransferase